MLDTQIAVLSLKNGLKKKMKIKWGIIESFKGNTKSVMRGDDKNLKCSSSTVIKTVWNWKKNRWISGTE